MLRFILPCLLLVPVPAFAETAPAETVCSFRAWMADPDPAGTNVRAGPGAQSKVLAVLPQEWGQGEEKFPPEVEVIGGSKGWFLIRNATVNQYGDGEDKVLFVGPGWISAKLISFEIRSGDLLSAPVADAPIAMKLAEAMAESVIVERVHSCKGEFVEVDVRTSNGKTGHGWISDICANQVTTCN